MNEKEKKAIEDSKNLIEELKFPKYEDFVGRLCYKGKPIENILLTLNKRIEKQEKIINEYETECRQLIAFCRKIRKDYKHDVDNFNQGQEYKCVQFLSLLDGEKNWTYEGKYFDEHDRQIEELEKVGE